MPPLEICNACSLGDCFAIYPTRFGVYPFLQSMPKIYHCENDAPDHFYPHSSQPDPLSTVAKYFPLTYQVSQHSLTGGEWGLKVIQNAYVYVCFKNVDGSPRFWEYFHADDEGIFTRVQSVKDNVEEKEIFCSRSGHALYNKFIRISHEHTGKIAIGYSVNWLSKEQRHALLANEAALMTTIDLDQLKAGIVPDKQAGALAYKVENSESFDRIFEHQNSADGQGGTAGKYARTDQAYDVLDLNAANPGLDFPSFASFYSGKKAIWRSPESARMFQLMTQCTSDGSGHSCSVPIILGLFDPLGVAEEFNHATTLATINLQMWRERNAWPLGSISEYERIAGVPVKALIASQKAYRETVDAEREDLRRNPRRSGMIGPSKAVKSKELELLEEHLRYGWIDEVSILVDEQAEVQKVIEIHAENHKNWIDLKVRNAQKRAFVLACEVFMRGECEPQVDNAGAAFARGTSALMHADFWTSLMASYAKREANSIYAKAVAWARRAAISGKESVRDAYVKFYQKRLESSLLAQAGITKEMLDKKTYMQRIKDMIDEEVRELSVTGNRAAFAFTALSAISQVWAISMAMNDTRPEARKNNWGRIFLLMLDVRSLYVQAVTEGNFFYDTVVDGVKVRSARPLIPGDPKPHIADPEFDFRRMFSSTKSELVSTTPHSTLVEGPLEMARPVKGVKYTPTEYWQRASGLNWTATALLSIGNVFYFLAAMDTLEQEKAHNHTALAVTQGVLGAVLGLEVIRSLATRFIAAEACVFLGPWGAVVLIVLYLGVFIVQQILASNEIEPYGLLLRRTYYGSGELDRGHEHFSRREIFFKKYPSLEAEQLGFVKAQHAIRVTYRVDDEKAEFKFKFDNPESGAMVNVYYETGGRKDLIGHYKFGITYSNTWSSIIDQPLLPNQRNPYDDRFQAEEILSFLTNDGLSVRTNSEGGRRKFSIDYIPRAAEHDYFVNAIFIDHQGEDEIYIESDEDRTYR